MYKRKIENVLQLWLDDASHKPLVVKGVRQCGKTSSVMDFAQKHEVEDQSLSRRYSVVKSLGVVTSCISC